MAVVVQRIIMASWIRRQLSVSLMLRNDNLRNEEDKLLTRKRVQIQMMLKDEKSIIHGSTDYALWYDDKSMAASIAVVRRSQTSISKGTHQASTNVCLVC